MTTTQTDLRDRVSEVLRREISPALQIDGSSIEVIEVDNGIARLRVGGICTGCPSTIMTIIMGIEQELRRAIPQIHHVEAIF